MHKALAPVPVHQFLEHTPRKRLPSFPAQAYSLWKKELAEKGKAIIHSFAFTVSCVVTSLPSAEKQRGVARCCPLLPSPRPPDSLHGVDDLSGLHGTWVDDLIYVAQVAVGEGSRDVDEGLQLGHLAGH